MTTRFHQLLAAIAALAGLSHELSASDQPLPMLRQTNYLAVLPAAGEQGEIILKAERYSPTYSDVLGFSLIGPDSSTLTRGEVWLGREFALAIPAAPRGMHVVELQSGWNACRVDAQTTPSAFVAREILPLHTARGVKRFFFYVPRGVRQFSVWLAAETPGEGARVQIIGPDGRTVVEEEGDYDKPQAVRAEAPAGTDGSAWSLALLQPRARGLNVDDVKLWLDSALPPYLSAREDWALLFGKRKHP